VFTGDCGLLGAGAWVGWRVEVAGGATAICRVGEAGAAAALVFVAAAGGWFAARVAVNVADGAGGLFCGAFVAVSVGVLVACAWPVPPPSSGVSVGLGVSVGTGELVGEGV
jgi:hypothetical protein